MRVERIHIVFEQEIDDSFLYKIGDIIDKIKTIGSKVKQLNVPSEAPPEIPRLTALLEGNIINFCQSRTEIIINIPDHINFKINLVFEYANAFVMKIAEILRIDSRRYSWCGIICICSYPSVSKEPLFPNIMLPVYTRILNVNLEDKSLVSLKYMFGYENKGYFENYTVEGYETSEYNVNLPIENNRIKLNPKEGELCETGITITVDINNKKPGLKTHALNDFKILFDLCYNNINSMPRILNLEGIIS